MLLEELLKDEREVGRKEGLRKGRQERTELQECQKFCKCSCLKYWYSYQKIFQKKINEEKDMEVLKHWIKVATEVSTIEGIYFQGEYLKLFSDKSNL